MPAVKQLVGVAAAIALAFAATTLFGISAVQQSAPPVLTDHLTRSKADFQLNDHQRLRKLLGIERPVR
jgi:hypothetical protein